MSEIFIADGWRVKMGWVLAPAMPIFGALEALMMFQYTDTFGPIVGVIGVAGAISFVAVGSYFAIGIIRRHEPVIEVSDARIEFGSIYQLKKREEIATEEIVDVSLVSPWLLITTRSGDLVRIGAEQLSAARRDEARAAIQRRIRQPS